MSACFVACFAAFAQPIMHLFIPEAQTSTLGASFLRWDAHNFGFDTQEHYSPSERAYYLEHGARIVRAMEENPVLRAKTAARTRYSTRWVAEHQLLPLLDSF